MVSTQEQIMEKLSRKIDEGRSGLDRWDQYTLGEVPLEFLAPEVKEATKGRLRTLQMPWARHVIAAVEERLCVTGFRTSKEAEADQRLWSLWQRNDLDEASQLAHGECLTYGRAFALVWADGDGRPLITVESARECAVIFNGATRTRTAGLKRWVADEHGHAVLFLPNRVVRFRTTSRVLGSGDDTPGSLEGAKWEHVEAVPNPLGVVPLVPLTNRPTVTNPQGRSELADLTGLLDAMTKLQTDMMVAAESHASPRRWASGIQLEEEPNDVTGQPTGEIDRGTNFSDLPGRLWVSEDVQSRFGEFPGSDLQGFLGSLAMLKRDLSAVASLPSHYLGLQGDQPSSADAIRSAEASLVALVRRKAASFAGAWEEVMVLASAIDQGFFLPELTNLETLWSDFETRTTAQSMDAASKGVASGILDPDFAAERYLGLTPTESRRNREARRARTLEVAAAQMVEATTTPKVIGP